jgi:hypothetical protein
MWGRGAPGLEVLALCAPLALVNCGSSSDAPTTQAPSAPASAIPLAPASVSLSSYVLPPLAPAPPLSARRAAALAADVAGRVEEARDAPDHPTRLQVVADTIVVVAGDSGAPFDAAVPLVRRTVDALYAGPFSHRPDKGVTLWLYSSRAAFLDGVQIHTRPFPVDGPGQGPPIGLYEPESRSIAVRVDAGGITSIDHELTHPLVEADFPTAPAWLGEAIPSLFEDPDFTTTADGVGIHGKAHFRLQRLRDTLASRDPAVAGRVRLDALFALTTPKSFYDGDARVESLRYALARESMRWLDSRRMLWPFYRLFRDTALEDPTGVAAFTRVVGKSLADANADWIAWIGSKAAESP